MIDHIGIHFSDLERDEACWKRCRSPVAGMAIQLLPQPAMAEGSA